MARITHVKKAQQRYATKPVIDPATGEQKVTPVISKKTGEQKVSKKGRPQVLRVTERDLDRPLPMPKCDFPGCQHESREIKVGEPYKHISPKSGPYGGRTLARHGDCPSWNVWDYSSSLNARIAQIQHGFNVDDAEDPDAVEAALSEMAEEIRSLAEEKRESAENIRDGFGHDTYQSEELDQTADDLEEWADEIESTEVPAPEDFPCETCDGDGEVECPACGGVGYDEDDEDVECSECEGTGVVEDCGDCDSDHLDLAAWQEAVQEAITVTEDCPV